MGEADFWLHSYSPESIIYQWWKEYNLSAQRGCWISKQFQTEPKRAKSCLAKTSELKLQESKCWVTSYDIKVLIRPQYSLGIVTLWGKQGERSIGQGEKLSFSTGLTKSWPTHFIAFSILMLVLNSFSLLYLLVRHW